MSANGAQPLPWSGVVTLGAALLLIVASSPHAIRFLVGRGWSELPATAAVLGAGAVLFATALTIVAVVHRKTRVTAELIKGLAFVIVTLVLIFIVQDWLASVFEGFGWSGEVLYYGAWLAAIVIVGWPADMVRKKLNIEFPLARGRH